MTEFFNTIDTWEREILEKVDNEKIEEVEPETITEVDDEEQSESFEAIDPSDDGLFQMLNASVRPAPMTSPKKSMGRHHHHHHHHPNHKANSPQRRSMKPRPPPSSDSTEPPLNSEAVVSTPKTEARKSRPSSGSGSRNTSRSHGGRRSSDGLSSSQKSSGSCSVSTNQKATTTTTTDKSYSRSKSQPRERGAGARHHNTHRRERNKLTEGDRQRSSSLGRKSHRHSDHGQNQLRRSHKSISTASSLSSAVQADTLPKQDITTEPPEPPEPPLAAGETPSPNDDIENGKEDPTLPSNSKGVVAMLSHGIASAARSTRKEAGKVVKGAANIVTHPKDAVRSVGEAASAVTTGVMNVTKSPKTESSSSEVNQQQELGTRELNRHDSEAPSVDSKSDSVLYLSRHESSVQSPKGTHKRHRERSRMASAGDVMSPQKPSSANGLMTRSEHLDRNSSESGVGSKPTTGRMTVRERRHQAAQQRNATKPESQQQTKTSTETRSRTISSPNLQRNSIDRKQSGQSQSSDSKLSDSSKKNDSQNEDLSNENDDEWLKARVSRQDDIMTFAKKKDPSERKPLSWNGREQNTMGQLSRSPRSSKGEIKLESSHDKNQEQAEQEQERKTILTAGAKVAKVAINVTALGAREAINAITNPKKEIEKVVRVSNKAAKKTARAASNPKETVQKVASITQMISLNVVREATEVTKGTLQLGKDTVKGTVGYVSGLLYEDDEEKEDARIKEKPEYDSQKLQSRQVNASLVDRVNRVVETSDDKSKSNSPQPPRMRESRRRGQTSPRPGMPGKMPSRLVVDVPGKTNNSWET